MQGSRDIQNAARQLVPQEHVRNFISFATKNYYVRQENMPAFIWKLDDPNAWYNLFGKKYIYVPVELLMT